MYILGQIIGVVGFILSVFAFMQRRDFQMKVYLGISSFLVAVSYYMIGAHAGACAIFISGIRNLVSARKNNPKYTYIVFLMFGVAGAIYTYRSFHDLLTVAGTSAATIALFCLQGIRLRWLMIVSCSLWLCYDIIHFSIGPMMMETFNIVACVYAIRCLKMQPDQAA